MQGSISVTSESENTASWYNNVCQADKWNPTKWQLTSEKVTRYAAIALAISVGGIIGLGLLVAYPQLTGAFFTIFGIVTIASILTLAIYLAKSCKQNNGKVEKPIRIHAEVKGINVKEKAEQLINKAAEAASGLVNGSEGSQ